MARRLRLVSWNVNGIRAAHRKGFLAWLAGAQADIVCVQETKIDEATLDAASPGQGSMRAPPGYHGAWAFAQRKGYSGVATFCKRAPLSSHSGLGVARFDDEGRVVETEHARFLLFNAYFPKGSGTLRDNSRVPYKLAFYDALFAHVRARERVTKKPAIVVGDFNTAHRDIDLKNARANVGNSGFLPEERASFERHLRRGFVDSFRHLHPRRVQYSWWSQRLLARERNVGWRIDYVWLQAALVPHLRAAFICEEVRGSDHCPVGVVLSF